MNRLTVFLAVAMLAAPAAADDDWGAIVAGRITDGAKTTTSCHDGRCEMITTLPRDDHGVVRQTIDAPNGDRWICTYDMPPVNVRLCHQYPEGAWRAEKMLPSGQMKLVGSGTLEQVYDSLGWPHR